MSDDQGPRDPRGGSGRRPEPDETGEFDPFADETWAGEPYAGQTRPDGGPRTGGAAATPGAGADSWISDSTQQMPTTPGGPGGNDDADRTRMIPPADDATRVTPRAGAPDATSMLPPAERPDAGRSEAAARAAAGRVGPDVPGHEPAWSARAQVRPGAGGDFTPTEWVAAEPEPRKHWWMPILLGVVAFLLVGLLGFGVWLITQGLGDDDPDTAPTTTATVPSVAPTTTKPVTEPTSAEPTSASPQQSSTPAEPEEVPIPALVGLSSAEAREALDRVGLPYRLIFRPSATAPAGTVIDSDPLEGREVPADTEVTLVIASTGPTSAAPSTTAGATTAPPDDTELPDED